MGYATKCCFVTKFSICWLTGFDVEVPTMSGISPALLMIDAAWFVVMNVRNLNAAVLCDEYDITLRPSPGNCTTPLMGAVENGGTKAATFEPIDVVYCAVSHVPSM